MKDLEQNQAELSNKLMKATSSNPDKIGEQFVNTTNDLLGAIESNVFLYEEIENDVNKGTLLPEQIKLDELMFDQSETPEWFQHVFQKEYQKQKKSFDIMAKKAYKMNDLYQVRALSKQIREKFEREVVAFRNLTERYQTLSQNEKITINISRELQSLSNRDTRIKEIYRNFCEYVLNRMMMFVEENAAKSLNFSQEINKSVQQNYREIGVLDHAHLSRAEIDVGHRIKTQYLRSTSASTLYNGGSAYDGKSSMGAHRYLPRWINVNSGLYR